MRICPVFQGFIGQVRLPQTAQGKPAADLRLDSSVGAGWFPGVEKIRRFRRDQST